MDWSAGEARFVNVPKDQKRVSSEILKANFKKANPGYDISEFVFFKDPERSVRIRAFNPKGPKLAMVYADPYSGKILKKMNHYSFSL